MEDCVFGMPVHRLAVTADPDDADSLSFIGTDRTEARSQGAPLIARCRKACAATCPTPGELGFLSDWGFILPPHLYRGTLGQSPYGFAPSGRRSLFENSDIIARLAMMTRPRRDVARDRYPELVPHGPGQVGEPSTRAHEPPEPDPPRRSQQHGHTDLRSKEKRARGLCGLPNLPGRPH